MPHILIVEDDTDINNSTAEYLRQKGCLCAQAFSGTEGRLLWQAGGVDLLLVDLMLPGLSGSELIREIRRSSRAPVIVLSAKTELSDKVELLGLGADDYLTKPYQLEELWARILVQLRHVSAAPSGELLRYRDWVLNLEEMTLTAAGQPVNLTAHEFKIVELLAGRPSGFLPSSRFTRRSGRRHTRWRTKPSPSISATSGPSCGPAAQTAISRPCGASDSSWQKKRDNVNFVLFLPFLCDVWALIC